MAGDVEVSVYTNLSAVLKDNGTGASVEQEDKDLVNLDADHLLRIFYLVIGLVGMVGNLLVILVLVNAKKLRKAVTNLLILNQSALDFTASVFIVATSFIRNLDSTASPLAQEIFCRVWLTNLPIWSIFVSSTYNLVTVTFERYFAIVYPLKVNRRLTRKKAYIMMAIVWFIGPAYNAAYMIPSSGIVNGTCTVFTEYPSEAAQRANGVVTVLLQFFIPLGLIIFAYVRIIKVLKNSPDGAPTSASNNREERITRARKNVIKTLLLVSACFVICWIWNQVLFLLFNLGYSGVDFNGAFYHFTVIAVFINSCLNPIVYAVKYEQFQKAAKRFFCCLKDKRHSVMIMWAYSHCPCLKTTAQPVETVFYIPKHMKAVANTTDSTVMSSSLGSDIEAI